MILRNHIQNPTINKVIPVDSGPVIPMIKNYIPPCACKLAQSRVVLEQSVGETLPIYKDAIDFVVCQLRSTIQHEAEHRAEELDWQQQDPQKRMTFQDLTDPTRAEIGPERAEENCLEPEIVGGEVENVTIHDLFERAKSQANIDPSWKGDIMAATLADGVMGQYLMKSMDENSMKEANQIGNGVYRMGNKLLIDARKHIPSKFIARQQAYAPVVQTPGDGAVTQDPDMTKQQAPKGVVPSTPTMPTVPTVPSL